MGLPSVSTVTRFDREARFVGGVNDTIVKMSSNLYNGNLVVEASDEARVKRLIHYNNKMLDLKKNIKLHKIICFAL